MEQEMDMEQCSVASRGQGLEVGLLGASPGESLGKEPCTVPSCHGRALSLVLCSWGLVTGTGLGQSRVHTAKARVPRQCPVPEGLPP